MEQTKVQPTNLLTAAFENAAAVGKWVGSWGIKVTFVTFEYELTKIAKLQVASSSRDAMAHTCTQHPHSHSCSCEGATYHTARWHKEAFEKGTRPKTCKHVAALIQAGVFTAPPMKYSNTVDMIEVYETENFADLEVIDGKFCVPRSRTGGRVVEAKFMLPHSVTIVTA